MKRILLILLMGLCALPAWADWNVQANGTSPVALTVPASQSGYCGLAVRQNYPVSGTSVSFTVWVGATLSGGGTSVGARQPYVFPCVGSATYAGGTTVGWIQVNQPGTYLFTVSGTYPSTLGGGNNGSVAAVSGTPNQIDVANPTTAPTVSLDPALQLPGTVALGAGASAVPTGSTLDITATGNSAFGTINANGFFQTNLPNDSGTPTVAATTVCENSSGNAQQCGANVKSHVIGVCVSGCGATGYPKVAIRGAVAGQAFDATHAVAAGDWVVTSATPGLGADTGSGTFPTCGNQVIGVATSSGSASTTQNVLMRPDSLPPCLTLGQLQGYVSATQIGAVTVPLSAPALSTDSNGVLHAAAAGGGGIGGTVASAVGADGVANVTNFGALPASMTADGAMAAVASTFAAAGSSTSPATPTGTTTINGDVLVSVYALYGALTAPGTPTQRAYVAGSSGSYVGIWAGDQSVATAGAYSANTGTQTSNPWIAFAIPLVPIPTTTIAFVAAATAHAGPSITSITVNKPTGTATGNFLLECISSYGGAPWSAGGWAPLERLFASSGSMRLECAGRIATASEPSTYTFKSNFAISAEASAFILTYTNVAAIDNTVTSATMAFSSGDVGKTLCIWNAVQYSNASSVSGFPACGQIGIYSSSTTVYPLFMNSTTSALTSELLAKGTDTLSAAVTSARAALANAGQLYIPANPYFLTAGNLNIPANKELNITGAGASVPVYATTAGVSAYYVPLVPQGTSLIVLGDLANDPAISYQPATVTNQTAQFTVTRVADLTLLGTSMGGDGIDLYNTHDVIERNDVQGFFGDGILVSSADALGGVGYTGNIDIRNNYLDMNGYAGLDFEAAGGDIGAQMRVSNNELDRNQNSDLYIGSGGLANSIIDSNVYQWGASACAVTIAGPANGVNFVGNWHETQNFCDIAAAGSEGPTMIGNFFNNSVTTTNSTVGWVFLGNHFTAMSLTGTFSQSTADASNFYTTTSGPFNGTSTGTAGTATYRYSVAGGNATVMVYLNAYQETSTAQTWTFPFPFATAPVVGGASCGTYNPTATTTTLTLPANAAMTAETCQVVIQGQTL